LIEAAAELAVDVVDDAVGFEFRINLVGDFAQQFLAVESREEFRERRKGHGGVVSAVKD
jgi:hypothetical protein